MLGLSLGVDKLHKTFNSTQISKFLDILFKTYWIIENNIYDNDSQEPLLLYERDWQDLKNPDGIFIIEITNPVVSINQKNSSTPYSISKNKVIQDLPQSYINCIESLFLTFLNHLLNIHVYI